MTTRLGAIHICVDRSGYLKKALACARAAHPQGRAAGLGATAFALDSSFIASNKPDIGRLLFKTFRCGNEALQLGHRMDLDERFGECLPFQRDASEAELSAQPRSFQVLSEDTAPALKMLIDTAPMQPLSQVVYATSPILWLVDQAGNVRFAMEEVLNRDTGSLHFILPRNGPPLRPFEVRLGHPSLLEPGSPERKVARIGGELFYDPFKGRAPWVLSNNSGRYGKRPHIRREHLENVNEIFAGFGISLRTFFIYTPAA